MPLPSRRIVPLLIALSSWSGVAQALPDLAAEITDVEVVDGATVDPGDVVEGCAGAETGRRLLNFAIRTLSLGPDDLVMGDPACPDCSTHPGDTCANPLFECSEAHGHPHFEGFAKAELLDANGQVLVTGNKQGFCLLDLECPPNITPKFDCGFQGITAGCSDVYSVGLPCQYIDITDVPVPDGDYSLRVTLDDRNDIPEADESNNVVTVPVHVGAPPPPPPTTCPVFTATDLPKDIPDLGAATSTISTNRAGTVTRLRVVDLRGTHTYTGDLRVELQGPTTSNAILFSQVCDGDQNFDLDLAGPGHATDPLPCPLTGGGLYVSSPMASFVGEPGTGSWTLTVRDLLADDQGELAAWGLEVCTTCGNGVLDAGETCDDGNDDDGDCCSRNCDIVVPDGTSCDDARQCLTAGTCQGGICGSGTVGCDPCLACQPGRGCVPPEHVLCEADVPHKSSVKLTKAAHASRDGFRWSWTSGAPVALLDFGNPLAVTDLTMCVYDQSGLKLSATAPHAVTCDGDPCWTATESTISYRDQRATDGLVKVVAKAGLPGRARIEVKGKGANLGLQDLGMIGPVTVRLKRSGGPACWQARFPSPGRNSARRYTARISD